ncbi:glycerol-3-phosphate dehydrogenase/oxidase [Brevibacillus dissolubilis]|uniref:glycerol-3-phosphate dehydrogenase/oxidase n=1 Tax=Brevibacillus dissolubilis TaxID=1844116 RepID=UPI0021005364|nr:glycerol-3-phosphate dehydrogenase/oxidase [Brevibacillus dissolubilis]
MQRGCDARLRKTYLKSMSAKRLDLLVIGGGITGAGIAWDASLRGIRVGLVEMRDFASGTSSRSTKLIHGGLRYLKQGEVKLVMEVGRERELLHQKLPHLVIPAPMILPIYRHGSLGYLSTSVGLYVYDLLAGVKRHERRKMLSAKETLRREPNLHDDGLKGSGYYYEYRTDDARLTTELIKTAALNGATICNYAQVTEFLYDGYGYVNGVIVTDTLTGDSERIYATTIVNAAGPWVDRVRETNRSLQGKRLFITKGIHLVFPYDKLPVQQAAYFDASDGRMIFVIPRDQITYVGTTDTAYEASLEEPRATIADRDYLLDAVNTMFPDFQLGASDIVSSWTGLRPLIYEEGKGPSELSRKDEIILADNGLITIAGGKLTGFRKMAEKTVDLVAARLQKIEDEKYPPCTTAQAPITSGPPQRAQVKRWRQQILSEGSRQGISKTDCEKLFSLFGDHTNRIYQLYKENAERDPEIRLLKAQLQYCITHEMTVTAADFLVRRTGMVYFDRPQAERITHRVVRLMGELLGWDAREKNRQLKQMERELALVTQFVQGD